VRGLIDSASGPGDISALWSWLGAGRVPGGPDLDSRLRWQILLRLTALGAASRAEIEHDADRDATAAGRLSAARCRAALPDDDAKRAAWAAMLSGTLSGYELTATAQGFWQPEQAGLLAGYVPRYFAALAEVAAEAAAEGAAGLARALVRARIPAPRRGHRYRAGRRAMPGDRRPGSGFPLAAAAPGRPGRGPAPCDRGARCLLSRAF